MARVEDIYELTGDPRYDFTRDPRLEWDSTAAKDTHLWETVLRITYKHCRRTCYVLWFFRQSGARLVLRENGLRMVPVFSEDKDVSEWSTPEEYESERREWLMPHRKTIEFVFAKAFEELQKDLQAEVS